MDEQEEQEYPFSQKRQYQLQLQFDSLLEYMQKGYKRRALNRIKTIRNFLNALEIELQDEPPERVDEKVLVFSAQPQTFLKLSFQGNLFALSETDMQFFKRLLDLVDERERSR